VKKTLSEPTLPTEQTVIVPLRISACSYFAESNGCRGSLGCEYASYISSIPLIHFIWCQILRPAGEARSLTHLAVVDGFEKNSDGVRGFRVGIDASIWFFHAAYGKEGENPELRTLFFRCATLMHAPFLPLFVFDGPKRPSVKRGKRVSGNAHWLTTGMKNIIEAFGFEWRTVSIIS
jgi:hypothetical protein